MVGEGHLVAGAVLLDLRRLDVLSARVAVGERLDVALREVLPERLLARDQTEVEQRLMPEPRVEQVQHGVLDAADVEVDPAGVRDPLGGARDRRPLLGHPVGLVGRVDEDVVVGRVKVSQVVPTGSGPVGHRVCLAAIAPDTSSVAEIELDVDPLRYP